MRFYNFLTYDIMSSEKHIKKAPMFEDKEMENVELHRAESMVNEKVEILDQINSSKPPEENATVYDYVGAKAQVIGSGLVQLSVELVMFLYMFSYVLRSITSTSMIIDKICLVHLGYSEDTCKSLSEYPKIKSEVEKLANNYHLGHSLLLLVPSAFLSLFIGSWSDKYSRKLPIICALIGIIIDGFGITLCAHYFYSRVEFYFISALFTGFSGGFIGVLMVLYSYASDVTSSGNRTMKYAFMEVAFGLSVPLGSLAGGWLFKYSGYVPVFVTSTCGHLLGLLWVIFFLKETRGLDNKDTWKQKFTNFWSTDSLVTSFKTTTIKRPNNGRKQIWLLIVGMSIVVFGFTSLTSITFIFVHHQFDWENTTYSTVFAVYQVIGLSTMLVIVPLSKRWNVGDPALGIVGSVSLILKNIGVGLAYKTWIFHLGNFAGLLTNLATLAGRARISKIVSKDDLGKVFAFLTTAEFILPAAAAAIASQVLNVTLDSFPGLIYMITGALGIIPLGSFIWIARLPAITYEEMDDVLPQENMKVKTEEMSPGKH